MFSFRNGREIAREGGDTGGGGGVEKTERERSTYTEGDTDSKEQREARL